MRVLTNLNTGAVAGDTEGAGATKAERRASMAHNRYVGSLKALAMVRRLALPDIRATINIDRRSQSVHLGQTGQIESTGRRSRTWG